MKVVYRFIMPIAFFLLFAPNTFAAFSYNKSITIDHTKVIGADQTNFPLLVSLSDASLKSSANGGHVQSGNGYDIYFYSDSGLTTRIPAERESYVASTGELNAWVKVASVSSTVDTVIYMAYGDSSISTDPNSDGTYGATNVWDQYYGGVWHNQVSSTPQTDSKGVADLTLVSATNGVAGKIGKAIGFDGSSTYLYGANNTLKPGWADFSISMWVYPTNLAAGDQALYDMQVLGGNGARNNSMVLILEGTTGKLKTFSGGHYGATSSGALTENAWNYITLIRVNYLGVYIINGVQDPVNPSLGASMTDGGVVISRYADGAAAFFYGIIDEVRFSSINRADGYRLAVEYNNQNSTSTFYRIEGDMSEGVGGVPARIIRLLGHTRLRGGTRIK